MDRTGKDKTGSRRKPASRIMAAVLAILIVAGAGSALLYPAASGISDLKDRFARLSPDAEDLMILLLDMGCPEKAARSAALRAQEQGLLPALSAYYVSQGASSGSAVISADRHMASAAVQDGRLYRFQITDPYQNAYLLAAAGMPDADADSAAAWLWEEDAGVISSVEAVAPGEWELGLPDGTFVLSGTAPDWILRSPEEGGAADGEEG